MKLEKASTIGKSLKPTAEGKDEYLYTENGKTEVLTFEGVMKRILAPIILPEGQAGTGTKAKENTPPKGAPAEIASAKTKAEASELIRKHLATKGIYPNDPRFYESRKEFVESDFYKHLN